MKAHRLIGPVAPAVAVLYWQRDLMAWYDASRRELPWRGLDDPYAIWVSEVMLQQTQVRTVVPYFLRWMERFPDLHTLAAATEEEVLTAWQGLGYYRRARALHTGAQYVVDALGGTLPRDVAGLLSIPGVGPYTAGALASIAFHLPVPAVDGNVVRVLSRIFALKGDPVRSAGRRHLVARAEKLVPDRRPGDWNQALMDLGATICKPRNPLCDGCPVASTCKAYGTGRVDAFPRTRKRAAVPDEHVAFAFVTDGDRFLVHRRPTDGLLGGLWALPGGLTGSPDESARDLAAQVRALTDVEIEVGPRLGTVVHQFTHKRWNMQIHAGRLLAGEASAADVSPEAVRWIRCDDPFSVPTPTAMRKALSVCLYTHSGIASDAKRAKA